MREPAPCPSLAFSLSALHCKKTTLLIQSASFNILIKVLDPCLLSRGLTVAKKLCFLHVM